MQILHLVPSYYPSVGGAQELFRQLSERLTHDHGDRVTVLTTTAMQAPHVADQQQLPPGSDRVNGVEVHRFPYWSRLTGRGRYVSRALSRVSPGAASYVDTIRAGPVAPRMLSSVMRTPADVLAATSSSYVHMFYPAVANRFRRRIPWVYFGSLSRSSVPRAVRRGVDAADAYVAYSGYERDVIVGSGVPAEKVHVVGLGVEPSEYEDSDGAALRRTLGVGDAPVVGYIGRLTANKGLLPLLAAMPRIWALHPDTRLLIAGAPRPFVTELREAIGQLGRPDRVLLVEQFPESERRNLYAACDVFVSVSSAESFGLTYVEAWASRKPVIGSRIGAVSDLIDDGRTGMLVEVGDSDAIAAAVCRLLDNPDLSAALARAGYEQMRAHHTWDVVTSRVRAIYEAVQRNGS
jgi:glycosyltransferase involved in cell wall biosynthesis